MNVKAGDLVVTNSGCEALVTEVLEAGYCWLLFTPNQALGIFENDFSLQNINSIKKIISVAE